MDHSSSTTQHKEIFYKLLLNWKLIVTTILLGIIVWYILITNTKSTYLVESMIQVERAKNSFTSNSPLESAFGGGNSILLDEQIEIYKSQANFSKLVRSLKLNLFVDDGSRKLSKKDELFKIIENIYFDMPITENEMLVQIINEGDTYKIIVNDETINKNNFNWNTIYKTDEYLIELNKPTQIKNYSFLYKNESNQIKRLQSDIQIVPATTKTTFSATNSLIKISVQTQSPNKNINVINNANQIFLKESLSKNKSEADQAIKFIQSQIKLIRQSISDEENQLNKIISENASLDIEFETRALIERTLILDSSIKDIELEILKSRNLYDERNPILISLITQKDSLEIEKSKIEQLIKKLPTDQQSYIDVNRDLEANKLIFAELLKKELEYSLVRASTIGNVNIIDDAFVSAKLGPRKSLSFFITVFISSVLGILLVVLKNSIFAKITSPKMFEDLYPGSRSIGVVTEFDPADTNKELLDSNISMVVSNLILLKEENNFENAPIFEIVSGAPSQGKSTLSELITSQLASRKCSTLLIDCDYKKGSFNRNAKKYVGDASTTFKNIDDIEQFKVSDYRYIIPAPSDRNIESLNIFESSSFKNFLMEARSKFDFIFIDSPAFLVMPDALVLSKHADFVLPVIRHNVSKVQDIKEVSQQLRATNTEFKYYIYNSFNPNKMLNYYGYYGYYGNYQYYYNEYKNYYEDEKNS